MSVTGAQRDETHPTSRKERSPPSPYDRVFAFAYASNALLMMAISLMFRYFDFVSLSGGAEFELGLIVGVGTIGSLAIRFLQAKGIDRIGARHVWTGSLACFAIACYLHLTVSTVYSPWVFFVRILMQSGVAGTFGATLTFISLRVPAHRITEVISMHGTSGFIGMAIGPLLGDAMFASIATAQMQVAAMFIVAGSLGTAALICAVIATWGRSHRVPSRRPPMWAVLKRYHPGLLLLVAGVMGIGLALPGVFVRPFAESLSIQQIYWYFIAYNVVAFSARIISRRLPALIGERRMIALGLTTLVCSMPTYLLVQESWHLVIPASVTGLAHALLFPAVVASGGFFFPPRYRGLATTLMLGMFDLGNLIGQPFLGAVITVSKNQGWPAYPTMFLTAGTMLALAGISYFSFSPREARFRK